MKKTLYFLMTFISILSFSQIKFEKAYFINNADNRVECLIKNEDWKNTPNSFEYKLTENSDAKVNYIKDVKLFEIYNQSKYVRGNVKLDKSSNDVNNLSITKQPEFVDQQIFLKELILGKISLYKFTSGQLIRYFYRVDNGDFEPLIYKAYETENNRMAHNEEYKSQLGKILVCSSINQQQIQQLQYKENYLIALFNKYYKCSDPSYEKKEITKKKGKFNLYIRPRVNFSSAEFANSRIGVVHDKESKIGLGFGIEAEYVLPFNKNKWAIIIEPTYQSFKSEKTSQAINVSGGSITATVDYKSIELPIGIRHYMFLDDKSKIFINAQYVLDFAMSSTITFTRNDNSEFNTLNVKTTPNIALGLGYNYKNKYGIEARFYTNRDLLSDYLFWNSKYKNISLILTYNLL